MHKGASDDAVLESTMPILDKRHALHFNTWYSSKLYAKLCDRTKNVLGTVKSTRNKNHQRFSKEKVEER